MLGAEKQEHVLRGSPRLVDDLVVRRLMLPEQCLVEDSGLQQSREYVGCGLLVTHNPALAVRPSIKIPDEDGAAGAGRDFPIPAPELGKAVRIADHNAVERQLILRQDVAKILRPSLRKRVGRW